MSWKVVRSTYLELDPSQLLLFIRRISEPLEFLPRFDSMLGGKTINIDVMVMQGPLNFNFLIGHYYIYSMRVVVSILFRVMHFPYNGNIVTIDQHSFIYNYTTFANPTSFSVPNIQVISP
jgi:hypothetical protein